MIYCIVIVDIKPPHRRKKCIHCKQSWCVTRKHTSNLCVVHKVCEECMLKEVGSSTRCQKCGQNKNIFRGETARDDFCRWLFSEANRGTEVLCHNFKGYDSYPILQYLYKNGVLPEVSAKQSIKAIQWLQFISESDVIDITHARNRREKQIGPFLADGYHETLDGEKIVYEFHGCFWHTCPKCFAMATMNPVTCTSMSDLYQRTVDKRSFLEKKGIRGKLMFGLCRTCMEDGVTENCCHDIDSRALIGTWVSDEIKKAVQKSYKIEEIYEVWNFDPLIRQGGVFTEYVNTFLKIKQEASGWLDWCKTEEDRQMYVDDYFEKEGIRLDARNIYWNP
ncbi:unnamed protein product [Mytilus coruscus]|uniref:DNA-directed DNA polymerase n=1 Tax=Mytilus coruscus TaxID=42192 RepID=A0A6J8CDL4_MYTCO|nr:unnamed protein product [Mytilus coruscus]